MFYSNMVLNEFPSHMPIVSYLNCTFLFHGFCWPFPYMYYAFMYYVCCLYVLCIVPF